MVYHAVFISYYSFVVKFNYRRFLISCGGLVEGLAEADFFECRSMPRNRELMRVFRDMELVKLLWFRH